MVVLQVGTAVAVVGLTLLVLLVVAVSSAVTVVAANERYVLTVLGETRGVLEPGLNVVPPFVSQTYRFEMGDRRLEFETEALSADEVPTVVRGTVTFAVTDPARAFAADGGHRRALAGDAREALRERVGERDHQELADAGRSLGLWLRDAVGDRAEKYGVEVRDVEVEGVERAAA